MSKKEITEIDIIIKIAIKSYQEQGFTNERIEKRIKNLLYPLITDNNIYEYIPIK